MANNEIHNYVNEQTTPTEGDFMDLDADQGGGNYLSKKMTLSNLRKWLFRWVNQDTIRFTVTTGNIDLTNSNFNTIILDVTVDTIINIYNPQSYTYADSFTSVFHIYNVNGSDIQLGTSFTTTDDNPVITTTVGGYAQVWVSYHLNGSTDVLTGNTINFI